MMEIINNNSKLDPMFFIGYYKAMNIKKGEPIINAIIDPVPKWKYYLNSESGNSTEGLYRENIIVL